MTQPPRDPRAKAQPAQAQQARAQEARDRRLAGESPPAAQATRPPAGPRTPAPGAPSSRPHFTGRAAVVAIVLCGIALSLAYPVREYISQRRQIDQLEAQSAQIQMRRAQLQRESKLLHSPAYIAEQARDRLHMCLPTQVCYVIIGDSAKRKPARARPVATPWYAKVWSSVQQANATPASTGHPDIRPKGTRRGPASRPGHKQAGRRAADRGERKAGRSHARSHHVRPARSE
jgi:cell division protein FtsB